MSDIIDAAKKVLLSAQVSSQPQEAGCVTEEALNDLESALDAYGWSDEPPTEDGVYYYRDSFFGESVVRVQDMRGKFFVGSAYPLHELQGQWAGPIPEPNDPEDEDGIPWYYDNLTGRT